MHMSFASIDITNGGGPQFKDLNTLRNAGFVPQSTKNSNND